MTWEEIARDHLAAAKSLTRNHPRSAASRAYYAVHAGLTAALTGAGYRPKDNRETPPHEVQAKLIGLHLAKHGAGQVRDLRWLVRRSYQRRIDADYRRSVSVTGTEARDAIRDASALFVILGLRQ